MDLDAIEIDADRPLTSIISELGELLVELIYRARKICTHEPPIHQTFLGRAVHGDTSQQARSVLKSRKCVFKQVTQLVS